MPESQSTAVDIDNIGIQTCFLHDCQSLCAKCLIEFNQINIVEFQTRFF